MFRKTESPPSLRKQAARWARTARAGRTYYVVTEIAGPLYSGLAVNEIEFKRRALVGLMHGSWSPEQLYLMHGGRVYEDRQHPDLAGLKTTSEMASAGSASWNRMAATPGWSEAGLAPADHA
ncbi:hypothetical protein RM844_30250 [Streptomyces sp. DSM 44915]|uniref:Uncharacterized protein n=1 Tax=Streptomyces chisholmiae TaxID=3075540 RepID=A0ABU2K2A9_9ACTN|nr:hypothetical protein [Streptomyces sp. DSM 44915]MDT0270563.1 hypothetical protein [Streptomyces sp. DSM 44915]